MKKDDVALGSGILTLLLSILTLICVWDKERFSRIADSMKGFFKRDKRQ